MKLSSLLFTIGLSATAVFSTAHADVNKDMRPDLLWRDATTGAMSAWLLDGATVLGTKSLSWNCGPTCFQSWKPVDFLRHDKLLWFNAGTGELSYWVMDGATVEKAESLTWRCGPTCNKDWKPVGSASFGAIYDPSLLWHNITTGELSVWMLNGRTVAEQQSIRGIRCDAASGCSRLWKVVGVTSRDGVPKILWHNATSGELSYWVLGATPGLTSPGPFALPYLTTFKSTQKLAWTCNAASGCSQSWKVLGLEDVNYDGKDDLVWYNATTGRVSAWLLNGSSIMRTLDLAWTCGSECSQTWKPVGLVPASPTVPR